MQIKNINYFSVKSIFQIGINKYINYFKIWLFTLQHNDNMTFKDKIIELIDQRTKEYSDPSELNRIDADYKGESKTNNDYRGRQLLELLQNADDAESSEVSIELNERDQLLIISNLGEPFTSDGIKSLMLANQSPKKLNSLIGDKGLGFRSIINWAEEIRININGLIIRFSEKIAKRKLEEISQKAKFNEKPKKMAVLAIPEVEEAEEGTQNSYYTTDIIIKFKKDNLEDIEKQIRQLKPEIMLFLNHIKKINISVSEEQEEKLKPEDWEIKNLKGTMPDKYLTEEDKEQNRNEYYLAIAFNKELSNRENDKLFAYFPTNIKIDFPFIAHGTFELNSSRNDLIKNDKNIHILKKLVSLIIDTALSITENKVSYQALQFLEFKYCNDRLGELEFYEEIDKSIEHDEIFPCLDGKYRSKSDVIYHNSLSEFIKDNDFVNLFPNLLIPHDNSFNLKEYDLNCEISIEKIDELSSLIQDMDLRVEFIYLLAEKIKLNNQKIACLIDNNNELTSTDEILFTPPKFEFKIPGFVKIKFIHKELFKRLIGKFSINSSEKARDLQRILKEFTTIQSYEPAQVLQKIVTSTNTELKKENVNHIDIINEMVNSLFENYQHLENTNIPKDIKVQLINKDKRLSDAKDLYLSKSYPSGKLTEYLFADVFDKSQFLADISVYELDKGDADVERIEKFFLWLGVNQYAKKIEVEEIINQYIPTQYISLVFSDKDPLTQYISFVFSDKDPPTNYRDAKIKYTKIEEFEKCIAKMSLEKIALWFHKDRYLQYQLDDENHNDEFLYSEKGEWIGKYYHKYNCLSYIKHQIISSQVFKDYLIDNKNLTKLINKQSFNYSNIPSEFNISQRDIETTLLKCGGVNKFEQLSFDAVKRILQELPEKSPKGDNAQTIYKLCIKHFEKNKGLQDYDLSNIKLFGTKGEKTDYFPIEGIYYNGGIKLPKKLVNSFAVLKYPRRQNTKSVIEFFKIKDLKSLEIEIDDNSIEIIKDLTEEFQSTIKEIKPFILAYRLKDIDSDRASKSEVSKLSDVEIAFCSNAQYTRNGEGFELSNFDYTKHNDRYLIKINKDITLAKLKSDFDFQESFADILGIVFDIEDTKIFRDIVSQDYEYIEKSIKNDIGYEKLAEARNLLGISDEYCSFWGAIYKSLKKQPEFELIRDNSSLIIADLKIASIDITKIDYKDLSDIKTCEYLKLLFKKLQLSVKQFNDKAYYRLDFSKYHEAKLKQCLNDSLSKFKKKAYNWCEIRDKQESFLKLVNEYEDINIARESEKLRNEIDINYQINYQTIVDKLVKDIVDLSECRATSKNVEQIYKENKQNINFEDLEGRLEIISLLYFKDGLSKVQAWLKEKENEANIKALNRQGSAKNLPIIVAQLSKPITNKQVSVTSHNGGLYNSRINKNKINVGKKAEEKVYNALVAEHGKDNVHWVSQVNDSAGYDLKYKDNGEWKRVEVKRYSNNQFFMSENEKEFAEKGPKPYEIFLVGDDEIRKIPDFKKENFLITPTEFRFEYELHIDEQNKTNNT